MFGIFTNCQWDKEDFNGEGVFTVYMNKEDLKKRDFSKCEYYWAQT